MPQGRYDPRLKSLLERKYGEQLPDALFQTDNSELLGAQDRYAGRSESANDLAFMSKAASRMGQLGGQRSESMFDPATVKGMSEGAAMDVQRAGQDFGDRDKVRKYIADKYLTQDKAPAADWGASGKTSKAGNMLLYNKRTGETKEGGPVADATKAVGTASSADIARADNLQGADKALDDMQAALSKMGDNRIFSKIGEMTTIGDTPYEEANRRWSELVGRMQSGGAINKDEEARFKTMAPSIMDSPEMRNQKYEILKQMLSERMTGLKQSKALGGAYRDISMPANRAGTTRMTDSEREELRLLEEELGGARRQ